MARFASALVSASSAASSGGAFSRSRLEAQQQAGQRLVDLVVEVAGDAGALLLLGLERGARGAPALGLQALEHPREGAVQARDLLRAARLVGAARRLAPGRVRSARSISSASCSRGPNRRWRSERLSTIVKAIAKASTSAAPGWLVRWMFGFAASTAPTTAATISSRFTASTWVSRSRLLIRVIIGLPRGAPGALCADSQRGGPPMAK